MAAALDDDRLNRNFQGYTTDDAPVLLGLGASAIGSLPQGYVQNTAPLKDYREAVLAGRLPIVRGVSLTADDRLRGDIIERLMCDLAVDLESVVRRHSAESSSLSAELARLTPLSADGIVSIDGGRIAVTAEGRPFVRVVAAAFDAYLQTGGKRHSRAV